MSGMLMGKQRLLRAGAPQAERRASAGRKMKKSFSSLPSRKEEQTEEDAGNSEESGGFLF